MTPGSVLNPPPKVIVSLVRWTGNDLGRGGVCEGRELGEDGASELYPLDYGVEVVGGVAGSGVEVVELDGWDVARIGGAEGHGAGAVGGVSFEDLDSTGCQ